VIFNLFQETSFTRDFERYVKEDFGNRHLSIGASFGEPGEGGSFTRDFERQVKEGSGKGRLPLCDGNLEGGLLYWGL
jgi:hypothetical protein